MKKILAVIFACLTPAAIVFVAVFAPWMDVMQMADTDIDSQLSTNEVMNFAKRDHYTGLQPFMADHFSNLDFNGDGFLRFEECRKEMQMAGTVTRTSCTSSGGVRNFVCKPIHQSITTKRSTTIIGSHS